VRAEYENESNRETPHGRGKRYGQTDKQPTDRPGNRLNTINSKPTVLHIVKIRINKLVEPPLVG
jgi:hypothetical protein